MNRIFRAFSLPVTCILEIIWVRSATGQLQRDYSSIFCVVDMHAITMPLSDPASCAVPREVAAGMIAAGVDPTIASFSTSLLFRRMPS